MLWVPRHTELEADFSVLLLHIISTHYVHIISTRMSLAKQNCTCA